MRRSIQTTAESDLFDLPLLVDPKPERSTAESPPPVGDRPSAEPSEDARQIELPEESGAGAAAREPLVDRAIAGVLDLAIVSVAPMLALLGAVVLGVRPALAQLPGYLLIALLVSFVYTVFSLVFWSRTLGMSRVGAIARGVDVPRLTVGQAVRRWAGGVATVALLGLPLLLVLRGASLADRLSATRLEPVEPA